VGSIQPETGELNHVRRRNRIPRLRSRATASLPQTCRAAHAPSRVAGRRLQATRTSNVAVETRHRPLTTSAALFALFLTGLWSGLGIAIKFGLEDAPPLRLGCLRFVLGWLTVLVWALWIRADLVPKRGEALALLAVGVMFCLELATLNIGLEKTTASHAAVILSTYSVWMAVFAHFQVPGDRLTKRKLLAALVSYSVLVAIFVQR